MSAESKWCACGHHAANHQTWGVEGSGNTRCIALGCKCSDFAPAQMTQLGEAWADVRETFLQAALPPLNRFLGWLNRKLAR